MKKRILIILKMITIKKNLNKKIKKNNKRSSFRLFLPIFLIFGMVLFSGGCANNSTEARDKNFDKGINAIEAQEYSVAIKYFDKALNSAGMKVGAEEEDISTYKAAAQYLNGDTDEAINTVSGLIKLKKDSSDYFFLRGSYYATESKYDEADRDYKKVIELKPKDYDMYFTIYENLTSKGQADKAAAYLDKVLVSKDKSPEAHIARGRVYYLRKDYTKARDEFKTAIKSGNNDGYLWMAKNSNAKGESDVALDYIKKYSQKETKTSESYNAVAEAEMSIDNYNEALKNIETALKEKTITNKQELLKNQVTCLEYIGKFDKAKKIAADYVTAYPTDREMLDEWQFLSTR